MALAATMTVSSFAAKIAVVNTQEIFAKYSKTKMVQKELTEKKAKLENDIKTKEIELQKLQVELQGKGANVTDAEKERFNNQAKALQTFARSAQAELSQDEYQKFNTIQLAIDASIQSVAKSDKFDYVLEAGAVKFGGQDITEKVLKKMEATKKIEL